MTNDIFLCDVVLIDPSRSDLLQWIDTAVTLANYGCKVRLVSPPAVGEVLNEASGRVECSGGGVANSYGHTTATSRVGMAWWSCSYGRKHVRIVSDRKPISGRH